MKTVTPIISALCAALLLSSCQWVPGTKENAVAKGKLAAAANLRDPSSAQFRNLRAVDQAEGSPFKRVVCGEMNGKNAHGAYAGFAAFVTDPVSGETSLDPQIDTSDEDVKRAQQTCERAVKDAQRSGFVDLARMQCDQFRETIDQAVAQSEFKMTYQALCDPDAK